MRQYNCHIVNKYYFKDILEDGEIFKFEVGEKLVAKNKTAFIKINKIYGFKTVNYTIFIPALDSISELSEDLNNFIVDLSRSAKYGMIYEVEDNVKAKILLELS